MSSTTTLPGVGTVRRIQFRHIRRGMTLVWRRRVLGRVVSVSSAPHLGTANVTLEDGRRLTYRGWMSRRLWRLVE